MYRILSIFARSSMVFQLSNALQEPEGTQLDPTLYIKELREYDVPYYIRIAMDLGIF